MGLAPSKTDKWDILINGPYLLEGKGIYMKDWEPNFDPNKEKLQIFPLSINLYNLPAEYWEQRLVTPLVLL